MCDMRCVMLARTTEKPAYFLFGRAGAICNVCLMLDIRYSVGNIEYRTLNVECRGFLGKDGGSENASWPLDKDLQFLYYVSN